MMTWASRHNGTVGDTRYYERGDGYYDDDPRRSRRGERRIREDERGRAHASRATTVRVTTAVITVLSSLFAVVCALHILFELLQANSANSLVIFVNDFARGLSLFFHDLFTFEFRWLRVLINYGLAALFWLGVGQGLNVLVRSFR